MAGDWIKMRVSLVTHPKVINLAETLSYDGDYQDWSGLHGFIPAIGGTKQDFDEGVMQALRVTRYVTVTALLKFWGYANEHAKGEFIPSLRINDIDEITQVPGFGAALESIGWAVYDEENRGTYLPNFAEHNATASDRGAAARQKRYREKKKAVTEIDDVTRDVTRDVTVTDREEKRREDIYTTDFLAFWEAYPKKKAKGDAYKAWKKVNAPLEEILAAIAIQKQSRQWQADKGQFIPFPASWLNARGWEDEEEVEEVGTSGATDWKSLVC